MFDFFLEYERKCLKDAGIDIDADDYMKNPGWKKFEQGVVAHGFYEQESWWIEKHIVGQARLERIYGPYMLGITRKLSEEELRESAWFNRLADKYADIGETSQDASTVRKYFHRKEADKPGLIERLKQIGIDFETFDDPQARVKLLYFLYCFERDNHIQIIQLLSKPTLENVDNHLVGGTTRNGDLIALLKNVTAREVPNDFIKRAKRMLHFIATDWEYIIFALLQRHSTDENLTNEVRRIGADLRRYADMISEHPSKRYDHSLLETFYLKLLQHECLGLQNDILDIENYIASKPIPAPAYCPEIYRGLADKPIRKKDVKSYLKDGKKELAKLVFEKDKVASNEFKKYDKAIEWVEQYLAIIDSHTKLSLIDTVSELLVINCMQEIVSMPKNEKVENPFYRYRTSDQKTLYTALKDGTSGYAKNQLALTFRLFRRYYAYAGNSELIPEISSAEKNVDRILRAIYRCNSLDEMQYLHSFIQAFAIQSMVPDAFVQREETRFLETLSKDVSGYMLEDSVTMRRLFATIANSDVLEQLAISTGKLLRCVGHSKDSLSEQMDITLYDEYNVPINYRLLLRYNIKEKRIGAEFFAAIIDEKWERLLKFQGA